MSFDRVFLVPSFSRCSQLSQVWERFFTSFCCHIPLSSVNFDMAGVSVFFVLSFPSMVGFLAHLGVLVFCTAHGPPPVLAIMFMSLAWFLSIQISFPLTIG
jgi:hypothetical protein